MPEKTELPDDSDIEFVELLQRYHSNLFGYIYAMVQNLADAEDLCQQTSMVLFRKYDQYERGTSFLNWALATAHFEILNFLKSSQRKRMIFSEELLEKLSVSQNAQDVSASEQQSEALQHCLETLKEKDRHLIDLCYEKNQKINEAAVQIGRSSASVYESLRRIRSALYRCIKRRISREGK